MWTIAQRSVDFGTLGLPIRLRVDRCPEALQSADEWEPMIRIIGKHQALYIRSCKTFGRDPISHGLSVLHPEAVDPDPSQTKGVVRDLRITPRQNQSMDPLLLSLSMPAESDGLIERITAHDLWPGDRIELKGWEGHPPIAVVVQDGILCIDRELLNVDEIAHARVSAITAEAQTRSRVVTIRFAGSSSGDTSPP